MNNSNTTKTQNRRKSEGLPDIKKILSIALSNWYLFVISFPICIATLFIYQKYQEDVYRAQATILLKTSDSHAVTKTDLIEGFGLSPELKTIDNQTFILRSKKVVGKAIEKLDFSIDIYKEGFFINEDLYGKSPFAIKIDSLHPQLLNTPIHIKTIGNNKVEVKIECENSGLYNFKDKKYAGGTGNIEFEKTFNIEDDIKTPYCSFKIRPVTDMGLGSDSEYFICFRSQDWLTNYYRNRIGVNPYKNGSSIIFISTTGVNTNKLIHFLNALTDVYLEQSLERKNEIASRTISFIDKQLLTVSDSLNKAQEKLMHFKRTNVFSEPTEVNTRIADQYFEIEKQIKLTNLKETYFLNLKNNLIDNPLSNDYLLPAFSDNTNSIISGLITDLITSQNEYNIAKSQTTDNNPYIIEINRKLQLSKSNLIIAIEKLIESINIEKQKLEKDLKEIKTQLNQLPELERKYLDIERSFKLNNAIYTFLLQKQSETQVTKASNTPDNEVIDNATISGIVSPNRKKNKNQALLLALIIPVAIIVVKEYLNNKVRDKNDISHIVPDISIIGFISQHKGTGNNVLLEEPLSGISESFRSLRTKLKYMCPPDEKQIITITSTNTGEGKTFCSLNLATAFAISGKKTALVGFDLRKPRLTEIFNHKGNSGLSNYLIGQATLEEITYNSEVDNLSILPSGAIPPNPSELIITKYAEKLFSQLKEIYDVIIVDSPPIGIVSDARALMEYSNCQLFVVRANKTIKEHFKHTIQTLQNDEVHHIALVFNDIPNQIGNYNYYSNKYYTETKN